MSDLIRRAVHVLLTLENSSLAKHEQVALGMKGFSGLTLSDLEPDIREQLLCNLEGLMAITEDYDIQEGESLDCMEEEDLDQCSHILYTASQDAIEAECDRLINELQLAVNTLPIATIVSIREHRDLMIPWLIGCIAEAAEGLRSTPQMELGNAQFFAIFLLSEFDAQEALPVILDALQLPGEAPFDLFGDAITETLSEILAQLARPSLDALMPLIENRQVNEFVRLAAIDAHYYALVGRVLERRVVLDRMQALLRRAVKDYDSDLATSVVSCLGDVGPHELMVDIESAYKAQLVDASVIPLRSIAADAGRNFPTALESIGHKGQLGVVDSLEELKSWEAFRTAIDRPLEARVNRTFGQQELARQWSLPSGSAKLIRVDHPGRNDPCPCGSHKKYKKCCGK